MSCKVLYRVPVINVFYDILLDGAPAPAQVNEVMGTFGLIAGLMVTVAQAVMNALSSDDATQYEASNFGEQYTYFVLWSRIGFACLSAAMLAVVVHYLSSSCSDTDKMSQKVYHAWWFWVRGNVMVTFVLTVIGLTGVMLASMALFVLQNSFSDEHAVELDKYNAAILCGCIMGGTGVVIPWLCMSLGLRAAKAMEAKSSMVALTVDYVYEQLALYIKSLQDENFFYASRDEFLDFLTASLEGKHVSMTPMSQEFASLAFDARKEEELHAQLRHKLPKSMQTQV